MKCKDCGNKEYVSTGARGDVCDPCMESRLALLQGVKSGAVSLEDFKSVQRAMNGDLFRTGRAKRKIDKLLTPKGASDAATVEST